jgi:ribosomal protein S21
MGFKLKTRRISVHVQNDRFDSALSKFKRKVKNEGILETYRNNEFHETESEKKQKRKKAARRRWLKKVASEKLSKR